MDELNHAVVLFGKTKEERQQIKDEFIADIMDLDGWKKEDIEKIKNNMTELKKYLAKLKRLQKTLPEK